MGHLPNSRKAVGGLRRRLAALPAALAVALALCTGCEEDPFLASTAGHDFGTTDPSRCAVMGDSIAIGYGNAGAAWPSRLAALLGRPVQNFGVGGMTSDGGLSIVDSVLAAQAGFVLIDFGANDAIHGYSADHVKNTLRQIVQRVRATGAIPLVTTVTPMAGTHAPFSANVVVINQGIHDLCSEENVPLVDVADAFGVGTGLLQGDGLHPNSDGQQLIAELFYLQLRHAVQ